MDNKEHIQTIQVQCYLKGFIDGLDLDHISYGTCKIDPINKNHVILTICGGFNGTGNWHTYLGQIETLINSFKECWIISLTNDCLDDLWELSIGISLNNLKI